MKTRFKTPQEYESRAGAAGIAPTSGVEQVANGGRAAIATPLLSRRGAGGYLYHLGADGGGNAGAEAALIHLRMRTAPVSRC